MTNNEKIKTLQTLVANAASIQNTSSTDGDFKVWKNKVEKNLTKIFGKDSIEFRDFNKLKFFYNPMIYSLGSDFTREHREYFKRDLDFLLKSLNSYIQEIEEAPEDDTTTTTYNNITPSKVFISHASLDARAVEEIIDLLETIGLTNNQIFCSSFEGYGIDLGDNFLEAIKREINDSVLVLFVLSKNFYDSPVCLCEMGATWVKSTEHIPVLIPPFEFSDIKGVIPLTQGFKINDAKKWNLLKQKIEAGFGLSPMDFSAWERKRDKAIQNINKIIT
ncbi:MAG: toll/interleukin-1 receptor domain-containing protein [Bacteroidota bacterium]|nr:toll/interleukin-1 receptor domain-containing protein [Bacteroidota bacterium]